MVTTALYCFARWYFEKPRRRIFRSLAVLSMAVAVMVKGPLGLIIPLVTFGAFLAWRHGRGAPSLLAGFFSPGNILFFLLVTLPWPLAMYYRFGEAYLAHVFLRETVERIGVTATSLTGNALRYAWALVRYLFPWWLALLPFLSEAARRGTGERARVGGEDGGRTQFLLLNIATVLLLLLFVLKTYSFKYLLPLTPAFSLLVGGQLAGHGNAGRSPGQRLRAFHLGAIALIGGVGLAGFGLFLVGFRLPEIRSPWLLHLAVLSLAGIIVSTRLRSRGRHEWAAGAVAGIMLLQLSLLMGTILPLLRPDAVSTLGKVHLKGVLRQEDRIVAVGLDERRRAWLSLAAGRPVDSGLGDQPTSHAGEPPPMPAERRTYLVVRDEELASLPADLRQRYHMAAAASEFRRIDVTSLLLGWKRGTSTEIARRAYYLLIESDAPDSAVEGAGDG
jgi:hypothetical protein